MSNKEVCDFCGEEAENGAAGWYRVSMQGKTEDDWEYADFCSLSCLFDWASRRIHHHSYGKPAEPPKEAKPAKCPCPCPRMIPMPYPVYPPATTWPNDPTRITWHIDTGSTTADNAK